MKITIETYKSGGKYNATYTTGTVLPSIPVFETELIQDYIESTFLVNKENYTFEAWDDNNMMLNKRLVINEK